jgi:hypothetical protein
MKLRWEDGILKIVREFTLKYCLTITHSPETIRIGPRK